MKFLKTSGIVLCIGMLATSAFAGLLGKSKTWTPDGKNTKITLAEGEKIFVMPADLHVSGDKEELGKLFYAGFQGAMGTNGISGQPLKPALETIGLGNLSWELAHAMVHAAFFHNSTKWDACGGEDYTNVETALPKLMTFIAEKSGSNCRYVAVAHVDEVSAGKLGRLAGATKVRVIGGIYDTKEGKIAFAIEKEDTLPKKEAAIKTKMGTLGKELLGAMVE